MGTTLIYGAALLFVAAIASGSNDGIPASKTLKTQAENSVAKSKRGVVDTGTNIYGNNAAYQRKPAVPSPSSSPASYTSGTTHYNSPLTGSSSPVQNQGSSYSSPSLGASADESFGNIGQAFANGEPIFLGSLQKFDGAGEGLSASFSYPGAQPATNSPQRSNSQAGQIQSGPAGTPYYASFSNPPISLKEYTDKFSAEQNFGIPVQIPFENQNSEKTQPIYAPSYFLPNLASYAFQTPADLTQQSPYAANGGPVFSAASQTQRNTLKANPSGQKSQIYAPYHQSASSFVPTVRQSVPTVDFNGKQLPLPVLQAQSATHFPGFAQSINSQPLVSAANNEFAFLAQFAKGLNPQGGNIQPFQNNQQQSQPQVVPVRSANGSPQFPQYKGARLNTATNYNLATPGVYEPLNAQPQLHFNAKPATIPPAPTPLSLSSGISFPPLKTSRPVAENRDDVEIIKKKKPAPEPHDFDEDEVDEGYRAIEREYGRQSEDAEDEGSQRGQNLRESDSESDFKPSTNFPFKSYDEKFSKLTKFGSSDEDSDGDRPSSRYHSSSSSEEEDDHDGHSSNQYANYKSPKSRPSRYEDSAEESQHSERQEEAEEDDDHETRPSAYSSYGHDFEQEFEDSYKRDLPMSKYVHVKEVPEIDETSASSQKSSYSSPKSSKSSHPGRKVHHRDEPEETGSYSTHSYQTQGKTPKTRDGDGYRASIRSYNKGNSPKVIHEDSFGYKTPGAEGYSKYQKSPSGDSYAAVKKSPKMDSYVKSSRSSYKTPKKDNNGFENGDAYSYSSGSSWKSDKKSPESGDYHGHASSPVISLVYPASQSGFNAPSSLGGSFFTRDLTGI